MTERSTGTAASPADGSPGTDMPTMGLPIAVPLGSPAETDRMTIGVAVEIPDPWGSSIEAYRESFGDPLAGTVPAHITLLPPTSVPLSHVSAIHAHLHRVARGAQPFDVQLQGTDTFRPVSPVVFVRVARGAPGCDALQQRVRTGPLVRELAFPYHPHVTVAHHVGEEALDRALETLADFSATFHVAGFCLYEHGADGVWRPEHRFPFRAA